MEEPKGKRRISREGRAAMGTAGRRNLQAYRATQDAERLDVGREMDKWRADMLADLGTSTNARRRALLDAACATYGCILLVINKLRGTRVADSGHLLERTSFLVGNLDRLLKRLELPPLPRPRSLAEVLSRKVEHERRNSRSNPADSKESGPKRPEVGETA